MIVIKLVQYKLKKDTIIYNFHILIFHEFDLIYVIINLEIGVNTFMVEIPKLMKARCTLYV